MNDETRDACWLVVLFVLVVIVYGLACAFARGTTPELSPTAKLGFALYADKRMSVDGTTACASCHQAKYGYSDGRKLAVGLVGSRRSPTGFVGEFNSPTLIGVGRQAKQFYDQRADSLFDQCLMPALNDIEMGNDSIGQVVRRFDRIGSYKPLFAAAFGDGAATERRLRTALVAFCSAVDSKNAPADFLARDYAGVSDTGVIDGGHDLGISDSALRGWNILRASRCLECHRPDQDFRDHQLHRTGIALRSGRGQRNTVKTPTLREIQRTAPYMRDGSLTTLREVVDWYNGGGVYVRGGQRLRDSRRDPRIEPLGLDEQGREDLTAALIECFAGDLIWYEPQ